MNKNKARLVTILIMILLAVLAADIVGLYPDTLPWILAPFAAAGAWKFARVLFLWLTTEDEPVTIKFPKWNQKKRRFEEVQE